MASVLAAEELSTAAGETTAGESSASFTSDSQVNAPGEFKNDDSNNNAILGGFGLSEVGKGVSSVINIINDAYNIYRANKKVGKENKDNILNRHRAGIVFQNKENRTQLVREGLIPAYYSKSNIKNLISKGILPFGWNKEMAIEQGFGEDVFIHEMKSKTSETSKMFLQNEIRQRKLKNSVGELQNLKERLKTRKILSFYK